MSLNLATAGLISGFGQGIAHGADQLTNAFIQSGLMAEREKYDAARQQLVFGHEDANLAKTQDFTAGQTQQQMGNNILLHGLSETGANTRSDATIKGTQENTRLAHELTNQGEGEKQRSEDARQLLDLKNKIDVAKISAGKAAAQEHLPPAVKAQVDAEMENLKAYGDQLKNALGPEEISMIDKRLEQSKQKIAQLVGVPPPPPVAPGIVQGDKWSGLLNPTQEDTRSRGGR